MIEGEEKYGGEMWGCMEKGVGIGGGMVMNGK